MRADRVGNGLFVVSLLILIGTIMSMHTIWNSVLDFEENVATQNKKLATHISQISEYFVRNEQYDYFGIMLKQLIQLDYLKRIALYINGNERIVEGEKNQINKHWLKVNSQNASAATADYKNYLLYVNREMKSYNFRKYVLSLIFSSKSFEKPKKNIVLSFWIISGLLLLLGILVWWLLLTRRQLAIAEQTKFEMIRSLTHDAKQDLQVIQSKLSLGIKKVQYKKGVETLEKDLCHAFESSDDIDRFLNNLKDQEKLERGETEVLLTYFDLIKIIEMALYGVKEKLDSRGMKAAVETFSNNVQVFGDEQITKRVLKNLLNNSIKYGRFNTILVIKVSIQDQHVRIEVKDQGKGIPKDKWEKVFSAYYQINRKASGMGLGLSTSRALLRKMNGRISIVESQLNKGTTFAYTIPLGPNVSGPSRKKAVL